MVPPAGAQGVRLVRYRVEIDLEGGTAKGVFRTIDAVLAFIAHWEQSGIIGVSVLREEE